MNNIPVFDTQNGVGSLIIKDVPYTGSAYIQLSSVSCLEAYLEECISFCRAVGAEKIYASGHEGLEAYPYHTSVIRMKCSRNKLEETDAVLIPVSEDTLQEWLAIYRRKMQLVHNAAYMSEADGEKMLKRGDGYFIHNDETLLGIGVAAGDRIDLVASLQPGAGKKIVLALNHALSGDTAYLEVTSENKKAICLYERLGFHKTAEVSKWYKIF